MEVMFAQIELRALKYVGYLVERFVDSIHYIVLYLRGVDRSGCLLRVTCFADLTREGVISLLPALKRGE